ncbi:MAG: helix-turn-helix domain-containing protein [Treponema sp.]|jgi:transcriptional regulator with XRE-family HTH domain|nr:helix-turn-helix domain-containing protein [Treponema sp.]
METIEQRVAFLRKKVLGLNQTEFAVRIGLKQSVVSQWEVGITPLNDKNIILICHIFKVNEDWLRYGVGEVFNAKDDPILQEIMELVEKMDEPQRHVVLNYVRWFFSEQQALIGEESLPEKGSKPASPPVGFPLEPIRPDSDPSDFIEKKRIG